MSFVMDMDKSVLDIRLMSPVFVQHISRYICLAQSMVDQDVIIFVVEIKR